MNPILLDIFGLILGFLVVASITTRILTARYPEKDYSELQSRVRTWWIMASIFCLAMVLSRGISICFFAFVSFLALKEYFSIIPSRRADRRVLLWAYLAIPVQYFWVWHEWYGMFIIFIPVYMFLFLPFRMIIEGETSGFLKAAATIHWGLVTTVFSISHVGYMLILPPTGNNAVGGVGLVLFLALLTQLNDVAQYISGKMFGTRKIIPKVSPNKTWEGFCGGIFTTTLLAVILAPLITPLTLVQSLLGGLLISTTGFIGDVTISALKRDLGIKDSGSLLPGHGGILDRIDSLTFTAPLFFHFVFYLHY